jgi:hypothetical protein
MKTIAAAPTRNESAGPWIQVITQHVQSLRFGIVQIIVHDSKVVQIERTEKIRLADNGESNKTHEA